MIQETSDEELYWMNHKLPSQGRACQGRPPLAAYPEAETPRRPFSPEREFEMFSMQRVYDYLSHQFWWRRVSENGQVTLGGRRYGVGVDYCGQDVRIDFDADAVRFVARTAGGKVVKRFPPKQLTATHLIDRDDKPGSLSGDMLFVRFRGDMFCTVYRGFLNTWHLNTSYHTPAHPLPPSSFTPFLHHPHPR